METLRGSISISQPEWIPQLQTEGERGGIPPSVRTGIASGDGGDGDDPEISDAQIALALYHLPVDELPGLDEILDKYIFNEPLPPVHPSRTAAFLKKARRMGLIKEKPLLRFVRNIREYLGALIWP